MMRVIAYPYQNLKISVVVTINTRTQTIKNLFVRVHTKIILPVTQIPKV